LAVKRPLLIAGGCVVLVILAIAAVAIRYMPSSSARRAWKEKAIGEISTRVADPAWPSNELAHLKAKGTNDPSDCDTWLSERLIVMRNGDWLAYANICQKEDSRIRDLFLGRGSDGRWYYSTYHFCIGMVVLRMEEQSDDLAAFSKTYYLRPFDGHSDECLQKTWPPNDEERGQPHVPMRLSLARSSSSVSFALAENRHELRR
jgi:hypothetical protein